MCRRKVAFLIHDTSYCYLLLMWLVRRREEENAFLIAIITVFFLRHLHGVFSPGDFI
jgi:hypothetical protein